MKFGFVTCVQLGLDCMREIYRAGGGLELAVTLRADLAPRKAGRVYVDGFCAEHGVPLVETADVNDPRVVEAVRASGIDWLFIVGWSQIARAEVLAAPRRGALGMHPTLLPEGRGRAAIPWAILKGLTETGVTLFQLDERVDAGPVLARERLAVAPDETAATLYARVAEAHRQLIRHAWDDLCSGRIVPVPQDESRATWWPGRTPAEGRIAPETSVAEAERLVRAVTRPYPGAFWNEPGRVLRVWRGAPACAADPPPGAVRLRLRDGAYDALEHEYEAA
jgi:methionyl-tRNA formyltransferase